MARLDYRNNNAKRKGFGGLCFQDWIDYSKTIGFFSNITHFKGYSNGTLLSNSIEIVIEGNDHQGAWGKEGRIHYLKDNNLLSVELPALYAAKSAGRKNGVTCRINSTQFVRDLVDDFNFQRTQFSNRTTMTIKPPENAFNIVKNLLQIILIQENIQQPLLDQCINAYQTGWNL